MEDQERIKKLEELKKQRDELDKLILELSNVSSQASTNLPYSDKFLQYISSFTSPIDIRSFPPQEVLNIKLFVTKKCNQVSNDFNHTLLLINELIAYKENDIFIQIFAHKLIDQGRVQVSSHFESYKPLSFILFKLNKNELIQIYFKLMVTRKGNEKELTGIYSIYFGYLNYKEDACQAWFWLASVLNTTPDFKTGHVLESFFEICGNMLYEHTGSKFNKIAKYLESYFFEEINNPAVKLRITEKIKSIISINK